MIQGRIDYRAYQHDAVERLRQEIAKGKRRLILQATTGAGKTVCACLVTESAVNKGRRVLFLAHARELIRQCSDKLNIAGVDHGIIMAGEGYNLSRPVQVASKDTLHSRAVRAKKMELPPADLVIVDECHLSLARCFLDLLKLYPNAVILGLTATPARKTGLGLGDFYEAMVCAVPTSQLIAEGFLVPTTVYAPYKPDLKGVHTRNGEYVPEEVSGRMDRPKLVGDIVSHWKRLGEDRQTIVRATGVRHSQNIRDAFLANGIPAAHVDGETPTDQRDEILRSFANGDIRVLTNCNVINVGFDCPIASCLVDADPTKSYVKFRQGAGRIQRPSPGKTNAIYLDHADNVRRHGLPDADVEWELTTNEKAYKPKNDDPKNRTMECPNCALVFRPMPVCPGCGYRFEKKQGEGREIECESGQLVEVSDRLKQELTDHERMVRQWHKALATAAYRGGTCGMAAGIFKGLTGKLPLDVGNLPNIPPSQSDWKTPVKDLFPQYLRNKR